ncbi:hypothetical protein NQ317_017395 [Molorchus minor]|uniref:Uncharacterized protein n=1 Tax=Molorchus minor TaxID=1323400 RepID=A0ABQ9IU72_9CUCU|nr:hypothetical protein NQ317_017395 [Molorchus minor]
MSSILQPVDVNIDRSPVRKRARYEDDVEKHGRWSLNKNDVVLHEVFDHGVGRLDCDREEVVTDDDTIFNRSEPGSIDVSCASMTPNSRDKQVKFMLEFCTQLTLSLLSTSIRLAVLESTLTKESLDKLTLGNGIVY